MKAHASRFVVVGSGVLLAAAAGIGCARSAAETKAPAQAAPVEAPPIAVTPVAAVAIKVPRVVQLSGNLIGAEQAQVAAGAAGKILATYVERGSVVKKGAVLAKIDARMLGAQAEGTHRAPDTSGHVAAEPGQERRHRHLLGGGRGGGHAIRLGAVAVIYHSGKIP